MEKKELVKLCELARVVRSKNAGPLKLTVDLMFEDEARYLQAVESPALKPDNVASLYGLPSENVSVLAVPHALAIKIVMNRKIVAGSPGDRDVYGAQQHGPLLELEV